MPSLIPPAFRLVARLRAAPAFHPTGALYEGRAEVRGPGPLPLGEVDCLVRLSKGMGTPRGRADLLGMAVRLQHEPPVDVLCTTAPGSSRWARLVLRPRRRWSGATLTSLMPWRSPRGELLHAVVQVADPRLDSPDPDVLDGRLPVSVSLRVVGKGGDAQAGTVVVTRRSSSARPDFDPVLHSPAGWPLAPAWLARVRERAYAGSRAGTPADRAG